MILVLWYEHDLESKKIDSPTDIRSHTHCMRKGSVTERCKVVGVDPLEVLQDRNYPPACQQMERKLRIDLKLNIL